MEPCGSANSLLSLQHIGDDYVISDIDTVYPVLLQHFSESADVSANILALRIAFGPCLDLFAFEELDEKLLKHACPVARKVFVQNVREFENYGEAYKRDVSEGFSRCEEIASLLTKAIDYVAAKDSAIEFMKISNLILCSSELLYESYDHCAKCKQFSGSYLDYLSRHLTSFFKKAQDLQQNILRLLSKIEISSVESAMDVLNETLTFIYKSGIILLNLDVKAMADLWKGYICILDKYSEYLKNYHEISEPVECLSSNLTCKIENFISEDTVNLQNDEKTIKILCFLLKVIIKMTEKFTGCLKNSQNTLINLLAILNKFRHSNLETTSMQHAKVEHLRQLVAGVDPLLNCLINDKDFVHEFSLIPKNVEMNANKRYSYLLLSCLIVKKVTFASQDIRNLWFSSDDNILRWTFQILAKCTLELCLDFKFPCILIPGKAKRVTDCYGYLLMNVSAFLLMSTSREFVLAEKVLVKYILQPNPWCSLLAADVWCILARFADSELCYDQLKNLIKMLYNFGVASELPQKFLLESLIKRLFPLLSEKHKELLIENHPRERNAYLWCLLCTRSLPETVKSRNSSINNLTLNCINKFLSNRNFTVNDFEEMEALFLELGMESTDINKETGDKVAALWKFDSGKLMANPLSKRYLNSLCSATKSFVPFMSSRSINQVLREIKSSFRNFSPVLRLHCLDIVYISAKAEGSLNGDAICRLISSAFYELLTSPNFFIRIRSMSSFSDFAYSTSQTQIITQSINNDSELQTRLKNYLQRNNSGTTQNFKFENYLDKLQRSRYEHFCKKDYDIEFSEYEYLEPPHKKVVLEKDIRENSEVGQMIFTLKKEVVRIQQQATNLSDSQRKEISLIADILREILE